VHIDVILCFDVLCSEFTEVYLIETDAKGRINGLPLKNINTTEVLTRRYLVSIVEIAGLQQLLSLLETTTSTPLRTYSTLQTESFVFAQVQILLRPLHVARLHLNDLLLGAEIVEKLLESCVQLQVAEMLDVLL
jgi:hypothetical protein